MISILLVVVRVLIILLILRIVLRWFAARRTAPKQRTSGSSGERVGGQLLRDPQCGTYVAESTAVKSSGQAFCSTTCRDEWLASAGSAARRSAS